MDSWKRRARRALLLTLTLCAPTAHAIWPFPAKRFTANGLINAGTLGMNDNGRVVAFGDFNADQFLDAVFLDVTQRQLSLYLWDHDAFTFKKGPTIELPSQAYNVIPGDMTYDGKLDLLVMSAGANKDIAMSVYLGPFSSTEPPRIDVPSSTLVQPIPVDANGDMRIDLLGMFPDAGGSSLKLWQNSWNSSLGRAQSLFKITDPKLVGASCHIANPHSNAVVDLNGDCLADLFLVCEEPGSGERSYQIWVNMKADGFALVQSGPLPDGVGAISFADMDRDGTIDIVFPTCKSTSRSGVGTDCKINIAYNQQLPLCKNSQEKNCRSPEELCVADPHFSFDLRASPDNKAFVSINLEDLVGPGAGLLMRDETFGTPLPVPLKIGDLNLDGFPDIVPIVITKPNDHTPKILLSKDGRHFELVRDDVEVLDEIKDARSVAFIDLDEDGSLDLLVQRSGDQKITFVQNNFFFDAFFLRAIVLNGACGGWCENKNTSEKYHPFGVSYSGATYKYTVLDTSGVRSAAQVGQLPQTSYHSLLTPYSFVGLGRTNNYIENLFVGSTKHTPQHWINMEGVIPNSKVVIIPPGVSNDWRKELYLRPGNWIPWVGISVVGAMIILAVMTFVLHLNEKREDELERRRASHHINFDAL
ncbi:hypothetical protein EXIGLDRAFT_683764 [Exidia glandulosa HHB12029]|uniref:T-cell immunomodulatory protein TIP C2 domain-containing protein n=1 Tax=Exidia glandulosa HHB12029 TaxID=1314781 RepID=A0A165CZ93_EXIGL|nr:hypothetical protein EXIGLDRAFT_683764 [Exidia glandulosa HHB12029]